MKAIWLQAFTIYEELEEIMLMPTALVSTGSTVSTRHLGSVSTRGHRMWQDLLRGLCHRRAAEARAMGVIETALNRMVGALSLRENSKP